MAFVQQLRVWVVEQHAHCSVALLARQPRHDSLARVLLAVWVPARDRRVGSACAGVMLPDKGYRAAAVRSRSHTGTTLTTKMTNKGR